MLMNIIRLYIGDLKESFRETFISTDHYAR